MFRQVKITDFPPFENQTIEFPEKDKESENFAETHVLTGVNGTGKTRLLSVLAAVLGNPEHLDKRMKGTGRKAQIEINNYNKFHQKTDMINHLRYEIYGFREISEPAFSYNGMIYINDVIFHPIALRFSPAEKIPSRENCLTFARPIGQSRQVLSAIFDLKKQAIQKIGTYYTSDSEQKIKTEKDKAISIMSRLESAITNITGLDFKFDIEDIEHSFTLSHEDDYLTEPSISVIWGKNVGLHFSLLPDGLRSIIGWLAHAVVMVDAALQGKGDIANTPAIFLLDEIESHLHPSWQRKILPAFQQLFPKAQIFIATHSPFVISSINHGWIHRLKASENGNVHVEKAIPASKGDSYISVLEDIMGLNELQSYDPETEELLIQFKKKRDEAYHGNEISGNEAYELADKIADRSSELKFMMGCEITQMKRQLAAK